MDMTAIMDEVRLKLTGDVVDLELSDASLIKIINSCLREVQRYIDTFGVITVPFKKCIDVKEYKMNSVIGVRRAKGYNTETEEVGISVADPLYVSQWQILTGTGNISNIGDYVSNYASWSTLQQIKNTTSTDLSFIYDKHEEKLYVNVSQALPGNITIMYIPRFDDVSEITSDFWIDVLVRMAVAQTKIVVGRVRSKFKQSNALWVLDGDTLLQEGTSELSSLREELRGSTQLVYGID